MITEAGPGLAAALSNGIVVLKLVAASRYPLTAASIAEATGLSRATTHRLLRTLEHHDLLATTEDGRYQCGPGIAPLAASVQRSFRQMVAPALRSLADRTGKTSFVAVQDEDECVTLLSAIPTGFQTSIAQAPGTRHSMTAGAPGKAILSVIPKDAWPTTDPKSTKYQDLSEEIAEIWNQGYAVSEGEVLPGVSSIAVPLTVPGERPCALALLCTEQKIDRQQLVAALKETAANIENRA